MKRLHVHVSVKKIANSIHFYSGMFGAALPGSAKSVVQAACCAPSVSARKSTRCC